MFAERQHRASELPATGTPDGDADRETANIARTGVAFGLAAYLWWGLVPVYFKAVSHVAPPEVLAHRIIWSAVFLTLLLCTRGRWRMVVETIRSRRTFLTIVATAALIALNWYTFIWAVTHGQVLQSSLAYFISPLVHVLLGRLFLSERLRRWQITAVLMAGVGVTYLTVSHGQLPVVALVLAFTFSNAKS